MRAFALAFAVKALYHSSTLNNYTYTKVAELFGISRGTAKTLITELRRMGLVENMGPHLLFKSLKSPKKYGRNVRVQDYSNVDLHNLKEVERFLRLPAVVIKQAQIDYAVIIHKSMTEPKTLEEFRKAKAKVKRSVNKKAYWKQKADSGMAITTVMKASGLKRNSVINLLKWGEQKHLLNKKRRFHKYNHYTPLDNFTTDGISIVSWHGSTYIIEPNILTFTKREKQKNSQKQ